VAQSFGEWLRSEREKKGWTQGELAEQSGVSSQQISNIETGGSPNPQSKTREKLRKALSAELPKEVIEATERQEEIPDLGSLVDFDPYEEEALPEVTGVYVLYDLTERPVYVGKATKRTIAERIPEHYVKFWFKRPVVDRAAYIQVDDEALCGKLEQVLIKFLKSNALLNKQYVDRE
jgi:transcriptional regulator with XRE-family HTH domain